MRKLLLIVILPLILVFAAVRLQLPQAAAGQVNVRDYGAIPNDGQDDSRAIQKAINAAITQKAQRVVFEKGTYDFSEDPLMGTGTSAYMYVIGASGLTIEGAVDSKGNPATLWLRKNVQENCADLRQLLFVGNSTNVTVKNIAVDNDPFYYSAADVVSVSGNRVTMDILEGHPFWDGMRMNLPGVYDEKKKAFIQQRIIWTDDSGLNSPLLVRADGGGSRQRVYVDNAQIARAVERALSEGRKMEDITVFWFQGNFSQSAQMLMNYQVNGITYENINILNSTGFALTADYCKDVTYKNVKLAPIGNRVAVAPRDGFKMSNISGTVLMDSVVIDGMNDDGQNCHGSWVTVNKQIDDHTLLCNGLTYGSFEIPVGSRIRLLSADTNQYFWSGTVKKAGRYGTTPFTVETNELLPAGIMGGPDKNTANKTVVEFEAFYPDKYIVRNSIIRNSYRGLKISASNFEITNNVFEYNVYNILLGAENDPYWIEGRHPRNGIISKNVFRKPLDGISIHMKFSLHSGMRRAPVMENIHIHDNQFFDSDYGIWVESSRDVYIYNNQYLNVEDYIFIDNYSTENIVLTKPKDPQPSPTQAIESPKPTNKPDPTGTPKPTEQPATAGPSNAPGHTESPAVTEPSGPSDEATPGPTAEPSSEPTAGPGTTPVNGEPDDNEDPGRGSAGPVILAVVAVVAAVYIALLFIFRDKIRARLNK